MANEIKTTLHPMGDTGTNLYPNIKSDNIPDNLEFNNAQVPSSNTLKPYLLLEDNDGKVYKSLYSIAFNNFNIPSKVENNIFSGVNTFNNTTYFNGTTFHDETATFNDVVINGDVDFNSDITFSTEITFGGHTYFNDEVTISDTGVFKNYAQTQILGSLYLGSDAKQTIVNLIYPVGSIYMSVNDVNPSTLFGGTWVKLEDRFLLGSGSTYTNGDTGGEATHTLTIDEIPNHNHDLRRNNDANANVYVSNGSSTYSWYITNGLTGGNTNDEKMTTTLVGGGQAHNNMPPYLVVNMWKRTA